MTPPIRPEVDPLEALMALKAERDRTPDPLAQLQARKTAARQEEFRSGRLERRHARENANDQEALALAQEQNPGGLRGMVQRIPSAIAAVTKDIPGAEAAQAGVRSFARGQSYEDALGDVRAGYEGLNKAARVPLRVVGGGIGAAALPIASPAVAGATYGGLMNLLDADPQTTGQRALNTGIGATVGGALGKIGDVATTAIRGRMAPRIQDTMARLDAARAAKAAPLYDEALTQGVGNTSTPEIQALLQEPDIAPIVDQLLQTRNFRGLAPDDPIVLDAVYKALSDQSKTIGKQLAAADPSKPNIGRFAAENIAGAKSQFLDAVSGGLNAPMPAYRPAVQAFAEGSRAIDAAKRGYQAMRTASSAGGAPDALLRNSPDALNAFLGRRGPDVAPEAVEGALGFVRRSMESAGPTGLVNPLRTQARNALFKGGDLLRAIEGTAATEAAEPLTRSTLLDYLRRAGVAGATPEGF